MLDRKQLNEIKELFYRDLSKLSGEEIDDGSRILLFEIVSAMENYIEYLGGKTPLENLVWDNRNFLKKLLDKDIDKKTYYKK